MEYVNKELKRIFNNSYLRHILFYVLVTFILLIFAVIFGEELYGIFGKENYVAIHLILEIFIIISCMAIAIQVWFISKFSFINKDIYIGALFLFLALIEIVHTISYKGMPYLITESSPYEATWFYILERLFLSIGLLAVMVWKVKKHSGAYRWISYSVALVLAILCVFIVYSPKQLLPPLVIEGVGTTFLKNTLQYTALSIQVLLILYLVRHYKIAPRRSLLFVVASIYLIVSDILFTFYKDVYDIYNFLGHIFQLFAFVVLFRAIYYSAVEYPYKRMSLVNQELEQSKKEMYNMAYFDEITNLPNERFIYEKIKEKIEYHQEFTLLIFEFERLATIKSSLGTFYSEEMLRLAAERLHQSISSNYVVGKLREDQFIIIVNGQKELNEIEAVCEQIQQLFETPFQIQHFSLHSNVNIGIANYPGDAKDENNLIKYAQFAMYEAGLTTEHIMFYHSKISDKRTERVVLENNLYQAIQNNELFLQYQPQIDVMTGEIIALEALVRWNHPTRGLIPPAEFIPIAEQSGLIIPFGNWVLETACRETKELQEKLNKPVKVAVNLSIGQLFQANFVSNVLDILEKTDFHPQCLELEITETMTMKTNQVKPILHQLKECGISVAIDDFGTGFSSLSYLKDLPIDSLKIDRGFVGKIKNGCTEPLVDMILSVAKHLQLKVIAEGIETMNQLHYLKSNQCDFIQGFLICKPINMDVLLKEFDQIQMKAIDMVALLKLEQ